jgi:hypothetical protein
VIVNYAALKLTTEIIPPEKLFTRGISARVQCATPYEMARGTADDGGWIDKRGLRVK